MKVTSLSPDEYGSFYAGYISLVPLHLSAAEALQESGDQIIEYLEQTDASRIHEAYAPGKWTIGQSLQHIIDTDRIFTYRALCLGRGETAPLPGFDQNTYAERANVDTRTLRQLTDEFRLHRQSSIHLLDSIREADLANRGTVSNSPMSCRAMVFIMAGHSYHHNKIFRERYQ